MTADKKNSKEKIEKEVNEEAEVNEQGKATEETNERIGELEKSLATLTDSYQRLAAEYDNFRKRTIREKDEIYINSMANLVEAFLPVLDSMEMAKDSVDSNSDKAALKKGIEMMYRQFREVLDRLDIESIECVGEEFDPEMHHAVEHVEDDKYGENEVVQELVKGYVYKDKVIRHSLVKVAN